MPGDEGVGQELIGPKGNPVLGAQESKFAGWNGNYLFVLYLVDDIDEKPGMPAGGQDFRLRPLFSVGRDNVLAGQRGGPVDLVEDGDFVRLDMDIRRRRQADQRDHDKHCS